MYLAAFLRLLVILFHVQIPLLFRMKKDFLSFKFQHTNFNRLYFLSGKWVYLQFMRNIREPSGQGFLVNMTPLLLSEEKQSLLGNGDHSEYINYSQRLWVNWEILFNVQFIRMKCLRIYANWEFFTLFIHLCLFIVCYIT